MAAEKAARVFQLQAEPRGPMLPIFLATIQLCRTASLSFCLLSSLIKATYSVLGSRHYFNFFHSSYYIPPFPSI